MAADVRNRSSFLMLSSGRLMCFLSAERASNLENLPYFVNIKKSPPSFIVLGGDGFLAHSVFHLRLERNAFWFWRIWKGVMFHSVARPTATCCTQATLNVCVMSASCMIFSARVSPSVFGGGN